MNSIVFVNFECNESTKVVAQKIWQYDYGQILRIQGLNLPAAVEIHFSLQKTGGAAKRRIGVTRDGVTDVVIPDFILTGEGIERNYSAYAFVYLSDEESGQTEHRIELNITSRPEPEGSSKEDDTSFGAIMDAVNKIAEQSGQGVSDEKIAEAVNAYMEANPVEGNVTVDTDLSETSTNPVQNKVVTAKFSQLSDTIANKATLENNVIKFFKSGETDTELFSVDVSSIGGTSGLDLNNLTLSVSQVGEYQRLSMSDGTTTKTVDIPITVISDEQVQTAVETWLNEHPEAITTIQDGSITTPKLDFSFEEIMVPFVKVADNLETYTTKLQESQSDVQSNVYEIHLKAGHSYMITNATYPLDTTIVVNASDGRSNINNTSGWSTEKISSDTFVVDWNLNKCNCGTGHTYIAIRNLVQNGLAEVPTALLNTTTAYKPSIFKALTDLYIYTACIQPTGTQKLISKGSLGWFFDITNIPQYSDESCYLASSNYSLNASTKYDNSYTTYTGKALTNEHMVINWFKSKKNPEFERLLATTSRNVVDNDVVALILGDSITYAASNAGLQNAWRKYISTKLNLYEIAHAVSGTTMTYGYAFDWNGKVNTDEAYDLEMTGVRGIKTLINTSLTQVVSGKSPQNHGFTLARTSIAIIALGTNDFGANAPLGSVNTLDDDGTFYGATYQLYHYLHDDLQIPIILFVAPFKREDWSVNNSAPVPYTIYDMTHALAEISLLETDMYVFDCTDRWYLNYDDTSIRAKSFIDNVHIKPYAHHMFTIDLAKYVQTLIAIHGVRNYTGNIIEVSTNSTETESTES